jgi:hypothetical protein
MVSVELLSIAINCSNQKRPSITPQSALPRTAPETPTHQGFPADRLLGIFFSISWYANENNTFQKSVPSTGMKSDGDRHNLVRYIQLISITGQYQLKLTVWHIHLYTNFSNKAVASIFNEDEFQLRKWRHKAPPKCWKQLLNHTTSQGREGACLFEGMQSSAKGNQLCQVCSIFVGVDFSLFKW